MTARRPLSCPPTAPSRPGAQSGVRDLASATTLTALESTATCAADVQVGTEVPFGAPSPMKSLRCCLRRMTGAHARWSVVPCSSGGWVAFAKGHRGLVLTARGTSLELAVTALRDVALTAERAQRSLRPDNGLVPYAMPAACRPSLASRAETGRRQTNGSGLTWRPPTYAAVGWLLALVCVAYFVGVCAPVLWRIK